MVEVVYVITWRYGDGSGSGTVAAFTTEAAAEKMLGILNQQDSMRNYKIEPVPFDSAAGVPGMEKSRADMIALLRDPRFTMSGGSEFALQILAALGVMVGREGQQ